jgi:hypothetical protein
MRLSWWNMRKRSHNKEWLPWYRARNYKGNLSEAEKRQLDAFRTQPVHPAARLDQLPEEVQEHIRGIELELYDHKQQEAAGFAFFWSLVVVVLLLLNYLGCVPHTSNWSYPAGALLFVAIWVIYKRKWDQNAEEFRPSGDGAPSRTNEAFRKEWELNYIDSARRKGADRP